MSWLDGDLVDRLARGMPGSELQSLLLEVVRARARERSPHDVLAQYRRDRFVRPSTIDQRVFVELDGHLLAAAAGFDAIELSPVTPLGTSSTVAPSDQHRVLSALRATEVVSDPTNVLALECAERLRTAPASCARSRFPTSPAWQRTFVCSRSRALAARRRTTRSPRHR